MRRCESDRNCCGPTEVVSSFPEKPADQNAAANTDIPKQAVGNLIAGSAINRASAGYEIEFTGTMIDHVIARRINLRSRNRLRNLRGGRPYGKGVVASAAGGAILNQCIPHPDIQVVSVRDQISHPAITDDQSVGVTRPTPNFGMFYPNPLDGRSGAVATKYAIVLFGFAPVIEFSLNGEIGKVNIPAAPDHAYPTVLIGI